MIIINKLRQLVNSKKLVIFDLDGVIADSEGIKFAAYCDVFRRYFDLDLDFADNSWRGKAETEVMNYFISKNSINSMISITELIREKRRAYEALLENVAPITGVVQFVTRLAASGKLLSVATSSPRAHTASILDRLEIKHLFHSIVTSEDVLYVKPAPDVYIATLVNLKTNAEDAVVFEDTPTGAQAAKAAGIRVIPVLTSYRSSDFTDCALVIKDFEKIFND